MTVLYSTMYTIKYMHQACCLQSIQILKTIRWLGFSGPGIEPPEVQFFRPPLSYIFIQKRIYSIYAKKYRPCSGYESRVIVINPRAYMYINPHTVSGENAPIAYMKNISLS